MKLRILALIFMPNLLWAQALGFSAINRFPVVAMDSSSFEVIARGGRVTARDYWCAAGDYALSQRVASNARLYIAAPEGPSATTQGRKAVRYTLDPQASGITPISPQLSLSVKAVGDNMSVAQANQFCNSGGRLGF